MGKKYVYLILGFNCQQDKEWETFWTATFTETLRCYSEFFNCPISINGVFCHPSFMTASYQVAKKVVCQYPSTTNSFAKEIETKIIHTLTIENNCEALIIGQSYGGMIASLVGGSIAGMSDLRDRVRIVTIGSIYTPIIANLDILHIMNHGDIAFRCNGLSIRSDTSTQYYDKERQVLYTVPTLTTFKRAGWWNPFTTKAWQIHDNYYTIYKQTGDPVSYFIIYNLDFIKQFIFNEPFIVETMPSPTSRNRKFSNSEENETDADVINSTPPPNSVPALTSNSAINAGAAEAKKQQATHLVNIPRLPTSRMFGINTHKGSYFRSIKPLVIEKLTQKLIDAPKVDNISLDTYIRSPEFLQFLIILLRYYRKYHDVDKTIDEEAAEEIAKAFFLNGAFTSNSSPDIFGFFVKSIKDRLVERATKVIKRNSTIIQAPILQITVDYVIDLLTMLTEWRNRLEVTNFTSAFTQTDISTLRGFTGALDSKQALRMTRAINTFGDAMKTPMHHNVAGSVYYNNSAPVGASSVPVSVSVSNAEFGSSRIREAKNRAASGPNALAAAKAAKAAANGTQSAKALVNALKRGAPALFGGRTQKHKRNRKRKTHKRRR